MKKISIIGHVGGDPKTQITKTGHSMTTFSVAVSEKILNKISGIREDITTWFKVVAFGKLSEISEKYLSKGDKVFVDGKLSSSVYTNKNNEQNISLDVLASDIQVLTQKHTKNELCDEIISDKQIERKAKHAKRDPYEDHYSDIDEPFPF